MNRGIIKKRKAVFLDRDGVINEDLNYVYRASDLRLIPRSAEAVKILNDHGFLTVVITNQAGIAYGKYTEKDMRRFNQGLVKQLGKAGARIDAFYFCPHHVEKGIGIYKIDCDCRKPKTGMFTRAIADLQIDVKKSFNVGDKWSDMVPGQKIGCRNIFVRTGHGQEQLKTQPPDASYNYLADNLYQAVTGYIIKEQQ